MNAHVLLNLINALGKKVRCEALSSIFSVFPNTFNIDHECKILFII